MNDHLPKPIDPDQLFQVLQRWLQHRASLAPRPEAATDATPVAPPATPAAPAETALSVVASDSDPLARIPGLDVASGLRRVQHKRERYESLLRRFLQGQVDAVRQTRQALAEKRLADAVRTMHTLKGTAATIGAQELALHAEAAEKALEVGMAPAELHALLHAAEHATGTLAAALHKVLPVQDTHGSAGAVPTQEEAGAQAAAARAVLVRLKTLVEQDDPDALEILQQSEAILRAHLKDAYKPLAAALASYDADAGLALLEAALSPDTSSAVPPG